MARTASVFDSGKLRGSSIGSSLCESWLNESDVSSGAAIFPRLFLFQVLRLPKMVPLQDQIYVLAVVHGLWYRWRLVDNIASLVTDNPDSAAPGNLILFNQELLLTRGNGLLLRLSCFQGLASAWSSSASPSSLPASSSASASAKRKNVA